MYHYGMYYNKEEQLRFELVPTDLFGLSEREFVENPKSINDAKLEMKQYFSNRRFLLETLPPREALMFSMHYGLYNGKCMSYSQIGEKFGITGTRVGQVIAKSLRKLRHPSRRYMLQYLTDDEVGYTGKGYIDIEEDLDNEIFDEDESAEVFDEDENTENSNSQLESVEAFDYDNFWDKVTKLASAKKKQTLNARLESLTDEQKQAKIILDILLARPCDIFTQKMAKDLYWHTSLTNYVWGDVLELDIEKLQKKGYQDFINKIHNSGLYFKREFKYIEDWENATYASMIEKGLDNVRKACDIPKIDNVSTFDIYNLLETTIEELALSVRAFNCLKRAGVDNLRDLVCKSEEDLIKVRNLGKRSMEEVIAKVRSLGLDIRPEDTGKEEWIAYLSHMPIISEYAVGLIKDNKTTEDTNNSDEPKQSITDKNFESLLSTTIEELNLSVRAFNCLKRAGIDTVEDLVYRTEEDLIKVRNLGKRSFEEVIAKIKSLGLDIRPEELDFNEWINQLKQKLGVKPTPKTKPQVKLDINEVPEAYRKTYAIGAGVVAEQEVKKDAQSRLISRGINNKSESKPLPKIKLNVSSIAEHDITSKIAELNETKPGKPSTNNRLIGRLIEEKTQIIEEKKAKLERLHKKNLLVLDTIAEDISYIYDLEERFIVEHRSELIKIVLNDKIVDADQRLKLIDTIYNAHDSSWKR